MTDTENLLEFKKYIIYGCKDSTISPFVRPLTVCVNNNTDDIFVVDLDKVKKIDRKGNISVYADFGVKTVNNEKEETNDQSKEGEKKPEEKQRDKRYYSRQENDTKAYSITIDNNENIFVAGNNWIKKISKDKQISIICEDNRKRSISDSTSKFSIISGMYFDKEDLLLVDHNHRRIRKINRQGEVTTIVAESKLEGGDKNVLNYNFSYPHGVVVDNMSNKMYVSDSASGKIVEIQKDGTFSAKKLVNPGQLAIDNNNNIFVADKGENKIKRIDGKGTISTVIVKANLEYDTPHGVAVRHNGNVIISDTNNHRLIELLSDPFDVIEKWPSSHALLGRGTQRTIEELLLIVSLHSSKIPRDLQKNFIRYIILIDSRWLEMNGSIEEKWRLH